MTLAIAFLAAAVGTSKHTSSAARIQPMLCRSNAVRDAETSHQYPTSFNILEGEAEGRRFSFGGCSGEESLTVRTSEEQKSHAEAEDVYAMEMEVCNLLNKSVERIARAEADRKIASKTASGSKAERLRKKIKKALGL